MLNPVGDETMHHVYGITYIDSELKTAVIQCLHERSAVSFKSSI